MSPKNSFKLIDFFIYFWQKSIFINFQLELDEVLNIVIFWRWRTW